MGINIKRGYEILPNNDVRFGVKITNNDESVISDVQVILDHNESLLKLQGDMVRELDNIPPGIARTAEFILKPLGCVHKENIEATITYRDYRWHKHIVPMRPKEVHCVCPFLRPRAMSRSEFLYIYNRGHSIETGVNFEGIEASDLIAFLMQTCATRLYVVEAHSMGQDSIINFSGEAAGEKTYYLLTVLVKEMDGMTRLMLRAVSDKTYGLHGFLNEIVSEMRHLANTVSSAREIGTIKHEQVINIIDSVVQRSNITNGNDAASINIEDSVVQRTNIHARRSVPSNASDTHVRNATAVSENMEEDDEDISNMYNTYLEDVKAINAKNQRKKLESSEADLKSKARAGRHASERGSLYNSLRLDESTVKKRRYDSKKILLGLTLIAVILSTYFLVTPLVNSYEADGEIPLPGDFSIIETKVMDFMNAVNAGDSATAYDMYAGEDFLTPEDITTVFASKGIEKGSIKHFGIVSKSIGNNRNATVKTRCTVSIKDATGEEMAVSTMTIYFGLRKTESGWSITSVTFSDHW